jgi:hypothetical protein
MKRRPSGIEKGAAAALASLVIALAPFGAGVSCNSQGTSAAVAEGGSDEADAPVERQPDHEAAVEASRDAATGSDAGAAVASLSATAMTFQVFCGASATSTVMLTNSGAGPLSVSATTVGGGFSVTPTTLTVASGMSGALSVTASVPNSATAGVIAMGSLNLFTNDPAKTNLVVPLSATPTGATLGPQAGAPTSFAFPSTAVGSPVSVTLTLQNTGNAAATFALGAPSDPHFAVGDPEAGLPMVTLGAGQGWPVTATFTPTDTTADNGTATITASGTICGASVASLGLTGQGATGHVTGWPATVDFGPADCGGDSPTEQAFTVTNAGPVDVHVTAVTLDASSGFTTNVRPGKVIAANGGLLRITVDAPPVPANASATTPITATLSIVTDADPPGTTHDVTLSEEPAGAVLAFDTSPTPHFGSFGSVDLLQSAMQTFNVKNTGSAPANVALVVTSSGASQGDAGSPASGDSGALDAGLDAMLDATLDAEGGVGEVATGFSVSIPGFTIGAGGVQAESVTFRPVVANIDSAAIAMVATGAVCGALPAPISVSGSGLGGGPVVTPSVLTFSATCGGAAPASQSFVVRNDGTADLTWSMAPTTGPGASQYTVEASPAPGLLIPGTFSTVTVTAEKVPSPVANPDPSAFAAQIAITTDVPLDPAHVVTLGETPLGDQLSFVTSSPLRFGQVPIDVTLGQVVTVTNSANAGSPAASLAFALGGPGASGYVAPASIASLAPGASGSSSLVFAPTKAIAYPATLALTTSDALCTALPSPLQLNGTGTQGQVALSVATIAFGMEASDPRGFVDCGGTGLPQTLTVSNVGNQTFQITALSLGKSSSPFSLPPALLASLPLTVPIGGSASITLTPAPIPKTIVTDPNDPTTFSDTLTVTTNAALDAPHAVDLVMQARGAVIADTPLATAWSFGTVTAGSIQTFTSSIRNTGNAPVSVALQGLLQPAIFGLQSNPITAPGATTPGGSVVTAITGQFAPPSPDGSWTDSGTLVATPVRALCAPLPPQWVSPTISLSGATNSNPALTYAGSLTFPTTNCGSAAPAGQAVTITNSTNIAHAYSVHFSSGTYYSYTATTLDGGPEADGGSSGTIAANGTATIVVTPSTIVPGPGVTPGSGPYADDLIVSVDTSPPTQWTIPIAWTLNGAVLSLPRGAGPYQADSTGAFTLPMSNTGTSPAVVDFGIAPFAALLFSPAPPISVGPGIGASPGLVSASSDVACPGATKVTATFVYSGPVCQPFPFASVTVAACSGTSP